MSVENFKIQYSRLAQECISSRDWYVNRAKQALVQDSWHNALDYLKRADKEDELRGNYENALCLLNGG